MEDKPKDLKEKIELENMQDSLNIKPDIFNKEFKGE